MLQRTALSERTTHPPLKKGSKGNVKILIYRHRAGGEGGRGGRGGISVAHKGFKTKENKKQESH